MLRLINITIEGNFAEADFYPEDSSVSEHIVVDLLSKEIVSCTTVSGCGASYRGMARQGLVAAAEKNPVPNTRLVMWY